MVEWIVLRLGKPMIFELENDLGELFFWILNVFVSFSCHWMYVVFGYLEDRENDRP